MKPKSTRAGTSASAHAPATNASYTDAALFRAARLNPQWNHIGPSQQHDLACSAQRELDRLALIPALVSALQVSVSALTHAPFDYDDIDIDTHEEDREYAKFLAHQILYDWKQTQ